MVVMDIVVAIVVVKPLGASSTPASPPVPAAAPAPEPPVPGPGAGAVAPMSPAVAPMSPAIAPMSPASSASPAGGTAGVAIEAADTDVLHSAWPVSPEGIAGAVREALPAMKECYEGWLVVDPTLAGRVQLSFTIGEADGVGQVTKIGVDRSTVGHDVFEACVLQVFASLEFDAPDGAIEVSYPIVFATTGER